MAILHDWKAAQKWERDWHGDCANSIFEWIETGVNIGHLHTLHAKDLDSWLGGTGKVENINQAGCVGLCYYGVFTV